MRRTGGTIGRGVMAVALLLGLLAVLGPVPAARAATALTVTEYGAGLEAFSLVDHVTPASDGNIWFVDNGNNIQIGRVSPNGVITEFPNGLPFPSSIQDLTWGPDGNVWYSWSCHPFSGQPPCSHTNGVARMTGAGAVTLFTDGFATDPYPGPLTVGPDGNIWFVTVSKQVGRLTPAGAVTVFEPPEDQRPGYELVVGPDGNLWSPYACRSQESCTEWGLMRITTSGVFTPYPTTDKPAEWTRQVTAGPDGNIWFASGSRIGRATTAGAVTYFSAGLTPGTLPQSFVLGTDRALWFAEGSSERIGRIDAAGTITEIHGLTATVPIETLALGADGALWYGKKQVVGKITGFAGASFHPVVPSRLLDSRTPVGGWGAPLSDTAPRTLDVAGVGSIPETASSVVLNVTATQSTTGSFVTAWPAGLPRPNASNLNFGAFQTIPNLLTVRVGVAGRVQFATAAGATDLIADVVGYFDEVAPGGAGFTGVAPERLLDSRTGLGGWPGRIAAGPSATRTLAVAGHGGVPPSATAAVLNVTATDSDTGSFLQVWPTGASRPNSSNVNFGPGETIPNLVVVGLGTGGQVSFFNAVGSTHVVADVVGYFDPASGDDYHALGSSSRVLDDRTGTGLTGPWQAGQTRTLSVTGGAVPSGATGVVMNTTVTNGTAPSFVTVFPAGGSVPTVSNLNFAPGQTIPNLVVSKVSPAGALALYNQQGTVDIIGDVTGYFTPSS
jgi:streptogramin lyase